MNDELPERSYSAFWPLVILLAAFLVSYAVQLYAVITTRSQAATRLEQVLPNIPKAQAAHDRYIALVKDLVATSQKDQNAATIVTELKRAGILRERPNGTNAPPATPAK